jgi:hypothetical protein
MNRTVSLLGLLFVPFVAIGHHSTAEFDRSVVREFDGEVVRVIWRNPHVRLTIKTQRDDGTEELWDLESGDVNSMDRRGIGRDLVQVGDAVKVAGNPSTRRELYLSVSNILLSSGTELLVRGNRQPRWSTDYVGDGDWIVDESTTDEPEGIYRVWTPYGRNIPAFVDNPPLTESARAAFAAYDKLADDPALDCIPTGMPRAMTSSGGVHPLEFVQSDEDIHIRMEIFDNVRVIHMGSAENPEEQPYSHLGYSVGHWEGDTLVVTTTRIDWPYFDLNPIPLQGVPQSRAVEMVDRFTLNDDETELDYDLTVNDPATFTEPVSAPSLFTWQWQPGVEVEPYECVIG